MGETARLRAKAEECRRLAKQILLNDHRHALLEMAVAGMSSPRDRRDEWIIKGELSLAAQPKTTRPSRRAMQPIYG
jgi:hypothetical protein